MTPYEGLGGEAGLRSILTDFVGRMASDFVIGWLFEGVDLERLVEHELAFASAHLGGPRAYTGRPIGVVHRARPINRGMFHRRLALLRTVLCDHGAPPEVIEAWMAHDERLLEVVTNGADCVPPESP